MEEREAMNSSGLAGKVGEVSESYSVEPMNETPNQISGSELVALPPVQAAEEAIPATPVSMVASGSEVKKKRGRPRKYGLYGSSTATLSPTPISASIPLTGDYSARAMEPLKKKHKLEFGSPGDRLAYSGGGNFTPHIINVNAGEDVAMKILSFAQQGDRAICILASNGAISNVTLSQPNSSGGTLTYEGRFEILSLTGSFIPIDNGVTKTRSGGMSVSLAGPDGRVLGGGLAGMLVAAEPIQVVLGSFIPDHQQEQKPKKQKYEHMNSSTSFHGDNVTTINFGEGGKISAPANISFGGSDSTE